MDKQTSHAGRPEGPAERHGAPRWVKGLGVVGIVLLLLFVALHLIGLAPNHHFGHMAGHAADMAGSKAVR